MTTPQITPPGAPPDPLAPQPTFRATFYAYLQALVTAFTQANTGFTFVNTKADEAASSASGASSSASASAASASASASSASASASSATLASNYANADEDVAVGAGFSAKHFSLKSEAFKDQAQTAAAAAAAGAGLPSLTGNAGKGLRVASGESGVEFANLGGMIPVAKYTVSSAVAALEFTLPAGYTAFRLRIVDMVPATSGAFLYLRTSSNDGTTFEATADYDYVVLVRRAGTSTSEEISAGANQIALTSGAFGFGVTSGGYNGNITIDGVASVERTSMQFTGDHQAAAGLIYSSGCARLLATDETNAIQLLFSSGNIASGVVHVYGVLDGDA